MCNDTFNSNIYIHDVRKGNVLKIGDNNYELLENFQEGFDLKIVCEKVTDYFYDFDYILGDWAYGKLRLKGFYNSDNKKVKKLNDYKYIKKYIETKCAFGCKYFILKKIDK